MCTAGSGPGTSAPSGGPRPETKKPRRLPAGAWCPPCLAARGAFLRLVHANGAIDDFRIVQLVDRRVGFIGIGHFNETESAGAAGFLVLDHPSRDHFAVRLEGRAQIIIRGPEREIPNVYFHSIINSMEPWAAGSPAPRKSAALGHAEGMPRKIGEGGLGPQDNFGRKIGEGRICDYSVHAPVIWSEGAQRRSRNIRAPSPWPTCGTRLRFLDSAPDDSHTGPEGLFERRAPNRSCVPSREKRMDSAFPPGGDPPLCRA